MSVCDLSPRSPQAGTLGPPRSPRAGTPGHPRSPRAGTPGPPRSPPAGKLGPSKRPIWQSDYSLSAAHRCIDFHAATPFSALPCVTKANTPTSSFMPTNSPPRQRIMTSPAAVAVSITSPGLRSPRSLSPCKAVSSSMCIGSLHSPLPSRDRTTTRTSALTSPRGQPATQVERLQSSPGIKPVGTLTSPAHIALEAGRSPTSIRKIFIKDRVATVLPRAGSLCCNRESPRSPVRMQSIGQRSRDLHLSCSYGKDSGASSPLRGDFAVAHACSSPIIQSPRAASSTLPSPPKPAKVIAKTPAAVHIASPRSTSPSLGMTRSATVGHMQHLEECKKVVVSSNGGGCLKQAPLGYPIIRRADSPPVVFQTASERERLDPKSCVGPFSTDFLSQGGFAWPESGHAETPVEILTVAEMKKSSSAQTLMANRIYDMLDSCETRNLQDASVHHQETFSLRHSAFSGPPFTKIAYEMRHARDEQLTSVKSVRECCGLAEVPMKYAMTQFKDAAVEGKLTRIRFMEIYEQLSGEFSHEPISCDIKSSVFSLFDRDGNDCVDMMELICGASLLCKGSDKEKIEAVFFMFDLNGDGFVTIDEMIQFLMMVSQVVFERELSNGAPFNKDIFAEQVVECFLEADLDRDGKLSLFDFKKWFQAPRQEAGLLFTPIRDESNVSRLSSKS